MRDNGMAILETYALSPSLCVRHGGFAQLATKEVYNVGKVGEEDKQILKEIGWVQTEPHTWKIEWWD